jgi:ATP-binding cassette subfamily B protein
MTFFLGAIFVLRGDMTYGVLAAFMAYAGMFYGPIDFFTGFLDWWSNCMDAASRVFEVLDAVPSMTEIENPVKKDKLDGDIKLENISFEYEVGKPIIKSVSLGIENGRMLGIVGKTGAGKSTLINLTARLYDVTDGAIFIDGVNIKDYAFDTLRRNIGVVSQDTYLFIGSIAKNISYAVDSATMDEIIKASKTAFARY